MFQLNGIRSAVSFALLCSLNGDFIKWLSVSPTLRSCLDLNPCSKELAKGHNKRACARLSYTHLPGFPRVTAPIPRSQPAALESLLTTPQAQDLGERQSPSRRLAVPCTVLHLTTRGPGCPNCGMLLPLVTLQPNTEPCPTPLAARAWKHLFSLLFKHQAPSHKTRRSCLQKDSVRGPWPVLNQLHSPANPLSEPASLWLQSQWNTQQEPDINLLLKENI